MNTDRTFDPTRQEDINATRRINVGPSTVRPASSTIRPASATVRPASSTIRSSAMMGGSVRPNSLATPDDNVDDKYFLLKGNKYKNIQSLSEDTGEAQVFLVERDGEKYVLKIYYPNFDVNKKVLQTVYNFDFEMIVKVYDFGKTYVDGKHRYYELMEFLKGGTMQEYRLNGDMDKFRRIALQGAAALAYCHQCGILHKDIKPGNFFFRDKEHTELVLGDFGISSFLDQDGKAHKTTQARTPIYAAPEMYTDVIDGVVEVMPSVDFYSFGICLMTLWLGESPLSSNERTMMRQKSEGRLPRILELPSRVRLIVQGLTVVNAANRWGYKEVEEWFLGGSPKVDLLLLDNEKLAIGYLYNGRISQWLESCGNGKLSTIMKDIVANRYPVDQRAGLMSAIYNMEPTFAYKDVKGNLCEDVHSIALSLLSYQGDYAILLTNPNDTLFLYLEAHTTCNIDRLRSYFSKTDKKGSQIAVLKTVYEIDPDIPLLARYPSSTLKEIVESFGREQLTEDDWHSLTDGRLLAWMYSHEDKMVCESMRILTQGKPYSESLAYMVLYNLDREAGYDLRSAFTPQQIGEQICERLKEVEHLDDEGFKNAMTDIVELDGRFHYYAQLHGWTEVLNEHQRCFDLSSEENRERLGAYDYKTAVYRFCRILGTSPVYLMPDGKILTDGRELDIKNLSQIRTEIRNGSYAQWMSIFYHEDPFADFSEEYSYEKTLEEWLLTLGKIDKTHNYYKRFVDARQETSSRIKSVRDNWRYAKGKEKLWRFVFYGLCAIWLLLVLVIGVEDRTYLLDHALFSIGLPLGGMTALIVGTRAFFRGYDVFFSILWGLVGVASSYIPIIILKYFGQSHPELFNIIIVVITLVYMLICHLTDFRGDEKADSKLIAEVLENDIKSSLLEPLYYTFKTKSYKFNGSKFALLNDVTDQVRSISGESVLHYILWSLLALIFVLDFVIFSPKILNVANPDADNLKSVPAQIIQQLERDVE